MNKLFIKPLRQSGDTIVEVLIVLAILGLALSISYATANKGLQQSRNAQEHSEALALVNSQVELLRSDSNQGKTIPTAIPSASYCIPSFSYPGNPSNFQQLNSVVPANVADEGNYSEYSQSDPSANGPIKCIVNNLYHLSITYRQTGSAATDYYDFLVRWDGVGSLGPQQEEITYRID